MTEMPLEQYRPLFQNVQEFISRQYSDDLAMTIDHKDSKDFLIGVINRHLIDEGYAEKEETRMLAGRLYEDTAGVGYVLSRYIYREDFKELNLNRWNEAKVTTRTGKFTAPETFISPDHAKNVIRRILNRCGKTIDEAVPKARAQIEDSIRITATYTPIVAPDVGVTASIRHVDRGSILQSNIFDSGMATREEFDFILFCLLHRTPIIFSGETGAGKTYLANTCMNALPKGRRLITLEEDWREFYLPGHEWVSYLTRPSKNPEQNMDLSALIRFSMTEHPDYLGIGEITYYEAFPALRAARTHPVLTTTHSTSALGTHKNLLSLCQLYPNINISDTALMEMLIDAFPIVVYVQQCDDMVQRIMEIREFYDYTERDGIKSRCIFRFDTENESRVDGRCVIKGEHRRVEGISEYFQSRLRSKNASEREIAKYAGKEVVAV